MQGTYYVTASLEAVSSIFFYSSSKLVDKQF